MIELRMHRFSHTHYQMQYRVLWPAVDASGALCPGGAWSEWKEVPQTDERDIAEASGSDEQKRTA